MCNKRIYTAGTLNCTSESEIIIYVYTQKGHRAAFTMFPINIKQSIQSISRLHTFPINVHIIQC